MADEPERVPIGITRPLSGTDAMSIMFPGTVLALFALGVWGSAMNALGGGQFARRPCRDRVAAAFAALLGRFSYDFVAQREGNGSPAR